MEWCQNGQRFQLGFDRAEINTLASPGMMILVIVRPASLGFTAVYMQHDPHSLIVASLAMQADFGPLFFSHPGVLSPRSGCAMTLSPWQQLFLASYLNVCYGSGGIWDWPPASSFPFLSVAAIHLLQFWSPLNFRFSGSCVYLYCLSVFSLSGTKFCKVQNSTSETFVWHVPPPLIALSWSPRLVSLYFLHSRSPFLSGIGLQLLKRLQPTHGHI